MTTLWPYLLCPFVAKPDKTRLIVSPNRKNSRNVCDKCLKLCQLCHNWELFSAFNRWCVECRLSFACIVLFRNHRGTDALLCALCQALHNCRESGGKSFHSSYRRQKVQFCRFTTIADIDRYLKKWLSKIRRKSLTTAIGGEHWSPNR